ncbi:PH domain-containing protein [Flavobacterium aquidurense]|uniref:PH domain-containing protein n=1 Tax=Flavobacterium aquidurense TaxID=362413 RepID=UPI0028633DDE|nr:PH domain-containing protein [Flavobacterium aquidurense]MDR7370900.1 hypothetical protein [Flavobacterium aquidurense]
MRKFKSKISIGLIVFLAVLLGGMLMMLLYDRSWMVSLLIFSQIVFIAHMFANTYYIVEDEKLHIKSGLLVNFSLDIHHIKKISETNSLMTGPAASFDRLEITYNKFDTVLISPKEKAAFIELIKKINPEVEIKLKNKEARIKNKE